MAEETIEKKPGKEKTITSKIRENPWIISTVVLAAVALLLLVFAARGGLAGNAVSEKTLENNFIQFAQAQGVDAQVVSIDDGGSYYTLIYSIDGQQAPFYLTKDGKYFTGQFYPLSSDAAVNTASTQSGPVEIPIGDSPVLGNADAPLTIVEFSDFSCPYCGAASGQAKDMVDYMKQNDPTWVAPVPEIIKDYVNTGKAKLVYKYSIGHSGAKPATLVAFCLNDQGLFWEMHDLAFANQDDVEDLSKMKMLAQSIRADMTKLNSCLDSNKYDSKLDEDEALGQQIGIGGTPAIYSNGIKVANGAESYVKVKQAIEAVFAQTVR